jgi:Cd2+/Zn2+-exporting ATPase
MIGRFTQPGVYRELFRSHEFIRVLVAGLLAFAGFLWDHGHGGQTAAGLAMVLLSLALNGLPIIWNAINGVIERRVNVDELVSLAIMACLIQGEFLTAAVVSFVMVLGALIEQATTDSARRAIRSLVAMAPQTASLIVDGQIESIPVAQVKVGDLLLVKPGDRIPVDALIRKGFTAVDESSMTGEPIPRDKTIDDSVWAGTLNQNGVIEIEATRVGSDTTLGRIIRLVTEAEAHKPRAVRAIDRYARWFTPTILACAVAAWWLTGDVNRAVAVLIVGCPCALILAAPTAIIATLGRAARAGILVKGGVFLEELARADVVLFDKTGTLTEGKPRVADIFPAEGMEQREVMASAACVEQNSTHPLARAVLKAAHYARITITCAEEMFTEIGLGVRALVGGRLIEVGSASIGGGSMNMPLPLRRHLETVKENGVTPLVVYRDRRPIGIISVADHVRAGARQAIEQLKSLGITRIGMLSGDHDKSAHLVAGDVGLTDVWSELKPQDKLEPIRSFQGQGGVVVFVGDGINDAPALATANVGIAMGAAGTDVALETADIVLMHDDIGKIPFIVRLGRRMLRVIQWNIAFGMAFNALAVVASSGGMLTPIMGAVVHNLGSILVVLSSASLAFTAETNEDR